MFFIMLLLFLVVFLLPLFKQMFISIQHNHNLYNHTKKTLFIFFHYIKDILITLNYSLHLMIKHYFVLLICIKFILLINFILNQLYHQLNRIYPYINNLSPLYKKNHFFIEN
jgi:hypothetical protein